MPECAGLLHRLALSILLACLHDEVASVERDDGDLTQHVVDAGVAGLATLQSCTSPFLSYVHVSVVGIEEEPAGG